MRHGLPKMNFLQWYYVVCAAVIIALSAIEAYLRADFTWERIFIIFVALIIGIGGYRQFAEG